MVWRMRIGASTCPRRRLARRPRPRPWPRARSAAPGGHRLGGRVQHRTVDARHRLPDDHDRPTDPVTRQGRAAGRWAPTTELCPVRAGEDDLDGAIDLALRFSPPSVDGRDRRPSADPARPLSGRGRGCAARGRQREREGRALAHLAVEPDAPGDDPAIDRSLTDTQADADARRSSERRVAAGRSGDGGHRRGGADLVEMAGDVADPEAQLAAHRRRDAERRQAHEREVGLGR